MIVINLIKKLYKKIKINIVKQSNKNIKKIKFK